MAAPRIRHAANRLSPAIRRAYMGAMDRNRPNPAPDESDPDDTASADDVLADDIESGVDLDLDGGLPARLRKGREVIRHFHRTLPGLPGVYRMINGRGEVLYVGKAKSLKARVAAYARAGGHASRINRMIAETAAMEFVTTETETEALLLEANLIKQLRPRFNVLLRDDKSLPYILITAHGDAPRLVKHRGARNNRGDYFGPFASAGAVNRTLNALQRAFLLRSCEDATYEHRTRPCLLHQIKRCAGPCTHEVSSDDYAALVGEARDFLRGRSRAVKERLAGEMGEAAEALEFERAARLRDRLAALAAVQGSQDINPQGTEEADVFALHEEAGASCVEVFFFRNHQNWGNRAYYPRADRTTPLAEVLGAFVAQFYAERPAPRLVLLSHPIEDREVLEAALGERAGTRVEVAVPARGERRALVAHAARNAREALSRRLQETASQTRLLDALGQAFGLGSPPRRIEVYDNSHIMGTNAVGGMVVAGRAGFSKPHYRTFNIRSEELTPGDDTGMMREVLLRRFSRLAKEVPRGDAPTGAPPPGGTADDPDALPAWPDLVLVDGGRGQFEAARAALAEAGAGDVPLVAIAKGLDRDAGRETFHLAGREPFRLAPRDPALYFVQRLRDEAHRFAIGTHRAKRARAFTKNPLDEIAGIGPRRKRALLLHFGTAKAVSRASLDDLGKVAGVNAATARAVYDHFHEGGRG